MSFLVRVLRRVRQREGSVGLEAILSITLMLLAFFAMWEAATAVFNASKIQTSAQIASQGAIAVVDRGAYRSPVANNGQALADARRRAQLVGQSLVTMNVRGLAPSPSHGIPTVGATTVNVVCGSTGSYDGSWNAANCGNAKGAAAAVSVDALGGSPLPGLNSFVIQGRSASFSFAP
jgi:hypothetical protein